MFPENAENERDFINLMHSDGFICVRNFDDTPLSVVRRFANGQVYLDDMSMPSCVIL